MKGAGAMARNKYPEETVARILDVSLKLFLEKGYENTTIQDIIDALGNLSKGAIYHHFKSKEDILEAVCDQRLFAGVEALMNEVVTDKRLKGRVDMTMALGLSDVKAQMAGLVYRGFVTGNGFKRLGDTLRYLQAIEKRLEKMAVDPHRDRAQMLKVENVQQAWQQWLNKLPPARRDDDDVREIRWMIEELRVSFFAQKLGTPYPI